MFPAAHFTAYVGVHSVPPSSFVRLRPGKHIVSKYLDFDAGKRIRYRTDAEYEEHFRSLRASRPATPSLRPAYPWRTQRRQGFVLYRLHGRFRHRPWHRPTPRLDTISYYDDSEPNWNERPYFTKVEEKRGRTGWHINVSAQDPKENHDSHSNSGHLDNRSLATLGHDGRCSPDLRTCLASQGNRVVLSGIGGDEIMGGVPTPTPELENLIARARFGALAHQLRLWALEKRKPWFHLLL